MGRAPCCDKANVKRGPWSPEEDTTLKNYLHKHGTGGNWISLPQRAGLKRCGKSCRLRWLNYLRPDIKHGAFTEEEDAIIISLYSKMGSRWSVIAANLSGRTDNDVKNHWNTKLKKKLFGGGGRDRVNSNNNKFNLSNPTKIKNVTFTNKKIINLPFHSQSQGQGSSYTPTPSPSPSPTYLENTHNYSANNNYDQFYVTIPSFSNLLAQCNTTNNSPLLPFPTYNNPLTNNNLGPDPNHNLYPSLYPIDHLVNSQARIMSQYNPTIYPSTQNKEASSIPISSYSGLEDDSFFNELGFGLIHEVMMNPTCSYDDHQEDIKPQGLGQGCG